MTTLRRVRESLNAFKGDLDTTPLIVWVNQRRGEMHAEAVDRTLVEEGLTGDEPGLMLLSWRHPDHVEPTESRGATP